MIKQLVFLVFTIFFLISSCGVLLGPISELSLQQRLNKGWTLAYEFTTNGVLSTDISVSKVLIGKFQNEIRCFYFVNNGASKALFYFNTNSYGNILSTSLPNNFIPNKFDISYDNSNSSLIYSDLAQVYLYLNGDTNSWVPPFNLQGYTLIANTNILIGQKGGALSILDSVKFNDVNTTNEVALPDFQGMTYLEKCKNKFNNDTVIYAIYTNTNGFMNQMQMVSLNSFNNFMLNSPFLVSNVMNAKPILEANGSGGLYMVYNNNVYRYESSSKSFISEISLPYTFVTGPMNHIISANFVGDNFVILHYNGLVPNSIPTIWSYNSSIKKYSEMNFSVNPVGLEQIVGMDMYYDTYTYALYIGVLLYDTNTSQLHGKLYMNQM